MKSCNYQGTEHTPATYSVHLLDVAVLLTQYTYWTLQYFLLITPYGLCSTTAYTLHLLYCTFFKVPTFDFVLVFVTVLD